MVDVKVVPSSGKSLCKLDKNDAIVCYLKSPPERGQANNELIKYVAKALRIPQQQVSIIGGLTSRKKRMQIDAEITYDQLLFALGIEKQMNLV